MGPDLPPASNVITLPLPANGNGAAPAEAPPRATRFPKVPKKRFSVKADVVVQSVKQRAKDIEDDRNRALWLDMRLQRYAKFRGVMGKKSFPWPECSNVHLPMLQTSVLRSGAGLHNVVMTLRPLLSAKATSRTGVPRQDKISDLIDYQLFLEPGPEIAERRLSDFIDGGLLDGNGVCYTPWVRDERTQTLIYHAEPIPEGMAPADHLEAQFKKMVPGLVNAEIDEERDHCFYLTYLDGTQEREAKVEVYEDEDGALQLVLEREMAVYDGPVALPIPVEVLLIPTRCTNLQPPSEANPTGASYVGVKWPYRVDDVRRLKDSGAFNWLDDEGLDKIIAAARAKAGLAVITEDPDDALQEQKDRIEGREHRAVDADQEAAIGHLPVPMLLWFDRWDVDGDGLAEDVLWLVAEDADVLCEARLLTERWPALKPYRPFAEWCPIPVPGRWYGISLLELGESLYDLVKATFDQAFDSWTIGNLGFFFYGASSKLNPDIISIAPGQGYPVPGNPRETILFPNLPTRDQTGALGIIGLALQFYQQQMAQGGLQHGQVPTGKASALRTVGTTMALLQQGDVRADQLLIRLFQGLAQVALNFHRMNRHLLPPNKEIRVVGWDGAAELGYQTISTAEEIDAEAAFDFKPEFLNSNPETLRMALERAMQVLVQPLALQLGGSNAVTMDRLIRDYLRAMRLDSKRYWHTPTPQVLPPLLAEEAIEMVVRGQEIVGVPLEGARAHLARLQEFMASDAFGNVPQGHLEILKRWMQQVAERARQEMLAQQAAQFQQALQQGTGQEGVTTPVQEPGGGGDVGPTPQPGEVTG